jgi:hypothetical protein
MRGHGVEYFLRDCIPQCDNRHGRVVGVEGKNAERCRAEHEMLRFGHRQSDPARGQDTAELAVRKERDISVQRTQTSEKPIGTGGNLCGHFSVGAPVPTYIPVRPLVEDIQRALSFVIAIVPFGQVGFVFRGFTDAGGWMCLLSCACDFHRGTVFAAPRSQVASGTLQQGLLSRFHVGVLTRPCFHGRLLKGTAIRK